MPILTKIPKKNLHQFIILTFTKKGKKVTTILHIIHKMFQQIHWPKLNFAKFCMCVSNFIAKSNEKLFQKIQKLSMLYVITSTSRMHAYQPKVNTQINHSHKQMILKTELKFHETVRYC